ncbi:MAG: DEAD/DEAH box helicase family protein [Candidatus Roizmanbacteria bacterium]|nr:DEAD/DEAH box helicase family protein [Candidatus Roizmanbacteria bacterium]
MVDKKTLSERDICSKFITPSITGVGWNLQKQISEEVSFTSGRIIVKGKTVSRGKPKRADYILYYKSNLPIAVIEAKDNNHTVGDGMQQALEYAELLDIPFVFSSNGDGYIEHDRTKKEGALEKELSLESFPSPEELYLRYKQWKGITDDTEKVVTSDYFYEYGGKQPRYYQQIAINRTVEAIAKGQNRILLVMATGTGKTYTAFQIIWRLWKNGAKKRILFLADRNVLLDQAKTNDFKHFGGKMTKVKHHQVDKSYEVYLALYQGVSGTEEDRNIYKQFSPDFFDMVIIDECHRGSAAADSAWREILEYYKSATHIGLTATPKETKEISNIDYFGTPVYTYSLKQGIEDGFLAPYKVIRITLDKDVEGWRPEEGKIDKYGNEIPDRVYDEKDFDRNLVIDERTSVVAKKVTEFLKEGNRYDKTIIFCVDIDHAERMRRALVNENADLVAKHSKYIMRITGDNEEGKAQLDSFIDPQVQLPVIVTTSKLLTTGIDAQTCKLIVLDTRINSLTEFKQIIGRGTRINEDYGKYFFTIMDFRKATELFADPNFDGEAVQIYEPKENDPITPPDDITEVDQKKDDEDETTVIYDPAGPDNSMVKEPIRKYYVTGVNVQVINERVQYYGNDGKLITESLKDYTKKNVLKEYRSINDFLQKWTNSDKKQVIIEELLSQGVLLSELEQEIGRNLDPFDLICHVAFGKPPLTRKERADNVIKKNYFTKYEDKAKQVLEKLLQKYEDEGIEYIEDVEILKVPPLTEFGTPMEIINLFGGKDQYLAAIKGLEQQIYAQL